MRPHGDRDNANHRSRSTSPIDDAPKVYVERIDIVGNTRTRDYVIRREFDIGEGDPYNHALIEAANAASTISASSRRCTSRTGRDRRRIA